MGVGSVRATRSVTFLASEWGAGANAPRYTEVGARVSPRRSHKAAGRAVPSPLGGDRTQRVALVDPKRLWPMYCPTRLVTRGPGSIPSSCWSEGRVRTRTAFRRPRVALSKVDFEHHVLSALANGVGL